MSVLSHNSYTPFLLTFLAPPLPLHGRSCLTEPQHTLRNCLDYSGIIPGLGDKHDPLHVRDDGSGSGGGILLRDLPGGNRLKEHPFDIFRTFTKDLIHLPPDGLILRAQFQPEISKGTSWDSPSLLFHAALMLVEEVETAY